MKRLRERHSRCSAVFTAARVLDNIVQDSWVRCRIFLQLRRGRLRDRVIVYVVLGRWISCPELMGVEAPVSLLPVDGRPEISKGDPGMNDGNRALVERIFQDAQFIHSLGIELTSCGQGWCETRLRVS